MSIDLAQSVGPSNFKEIVKKKYDEDAQKAKDGIEKYNQELNELEKIKKNIYMNKKTLDDEVQKINDLVSKPDDNCELKPEDNVKAILSNVSIDGDLKTEWFSEQYEYLINEIQKCLQSQKSKK